MPSAVALGAQAASSPDAAALFFVAVGFAALGALCVLVFGAVLWRRHSRK